ncbi:ATP-binding cassette domain-containing protein [Kiloniella laminariae]|uniref:ATP-binding cassette domain-containing protein n=1 Tax=Kiloniella laminariae TaxID=454162 RepID=A0ABT4LM95_9PROT|nr:ATP-binding cassette domain-containing protein [Kiloniella laminariae]MCZ4282232.1 ATP-binding cassette domain-containing protein [Kiloniella laminariae]
MNTHQRPGAAQAPEPLILKDLTLSLFRAGVNRTLFNKFDLEIQPGEITTIMGPSGCGKSSLLSFISGTLAKDFTVDGRVCLGQRDITDSPPEQRHIGMLFQEDLLFPHLSVGENLGFGIPAVVRQKTDRKMLIEQALEEAGLSGFADQDPATLSGGQRARVAVMRTLLSRPSALLLDEPFSKLDSALRERFRTFVFDHARAHNLPTLLVTHDPEDARSAEGVILNMPFV